MTRSRIVEHREVPLDKLKAHPLHIHDHPDHQLQIVEGSLEELGYVKSVIWNQRTGHLLDGHLRKGLAEDAGDTHVPAEIVDLSPEEELLALALLDSTVGLAETRTDTLNELLAQLDADNQAVSDFLDSLQTEDPAEGDFETARGALAEKFLVPPFSVLDGRQGYWKERKAHWLALGIRSELGRPQDLTYSVSCQPPRVLERKRLIEHRDEESYTWQEFAERYPEEIELATTTSVFDPVLAEVVYRWFCPPGGRVLDPFAGGSVRGIVATLTGRDYTGVELRPEQVVANHENWSRISAQAGLEGAAQPLDDQPDLTPVETHGGYLTKRDDAYCIAGIRGGKARTCWHLAQGATGLATAGSRQSPQVAIVAHIAQRLGLPCRVHTPSGALTPELLSAQDAGAELVQHRPGHNSVIIARARDDAAARGWRNIPFGMECNEATEQTAHQVANLPFGDFDRIVIPVGSGMNAAGLLLGLDRAGHPEIPVLGIRVGADPQKRLDRYAPEDWRQRMQLVPAPGNYHTPAPVTALGTLALDPIYEAKCLPYLQPNDLFWIVGIREAPDTGAHPHWIQGDSRHLPELVANESAYDLLFTCPPYADLERYSDEPADLSTLDYDEFVPAYREIIATAAERLAPDAFAAIVVAEIRDPRGNYRNFISDTIDAFLAAGLDYYNHAIFVTPTGTLPMRAGRAFNVARKLGKHHQDLIIFKQGEPKLPDLKGYAKLIEAHMSAARTTIDAHQNLLLFVKGDPRTATERTERTDYREGELDHLTTEQ